MYPDVLPSEVSSHDKGQPVQKLYQGHWLQVSPSLDTSFNTKGYSLPCSGDLHTNTLVVEHWTTNILPTNEATLSTVDCSALATENCQTAKPQSDYQT